MRKELEILKGLGCDIDGSLERFCDDEDFYVDCIKEVLEDPSFIALGLNIKNHDIKPAFENSHTLKGIVSNVGLTPMYPYIIEMVEPLRKGIIDNLEGNYQKVMEYRKIFSDAISI